MRSEGVRVHGQATPRNPLLGRAASKRAFLSGFRRIRTSAAENMPAYPVPIPDADAQSLAGQRIGAGGARGV